MNFERHFHPLSSPRQFPSLGGQRSDIGDCCTFWDQSRALRKAPFGDRYKDTFRRTRPCVTRALCVVVVVAPRQRERSLCESETANSPYRHGSAPLFDRESVPKPPAGPLRTCGIPGGKRRASSCGRGALPLHEVHAGRLADGGATGAPVRPVRSAEQLLPRALFPPTPPGVRAE